MNPIHELINKLNTSSNRVLEELENETPSFERITTELNKREEYVKQLNAYHKDYPPSAFNETELQAIRSEFVMFSELNEDIQIKANNLMGNQKEKLAAATKNRKAEDQYKISGKPNISYF